MNTLVVRMVSWFSSLPSIRAGATTWGCRACLELLAQRLAQNEDAAHLDAAAGASGTGTNEHQHHQHFLGQGGPQVKIAAGKARGGDNGTHLERRLPQRLAKAVVDAVDVGRDDGNGGMQ